MHILYKGDLMSKKVISILFSFILVLFSFFYTNKIINIFKDKDPIMLEIKKYDELYSDTKIDSIIINNDIIPGIKGIKIDVDKSYKNMKKTKEFNKSLLVFKETIPSNDIKNNYNHYIVSMNKSQNKVSLIFVMNDLDNLNDILSILKNKNVNTTFFLSKEIIDNSFEYIRLILNNNHEIELLSDTYTIYEVNKYSSFFKQLSNNKLFFCLNKDRNDVLLKSCESSKLYSIVPSIIKTNGLYNYVKNNLENGLIIALSNNKQIVNELSSTINYIEQKGKKIVLLKSIIE